MTTNDALERMVTDRLISDAAGYESDRALDDALALTSRKRPYPQWLALLKEPPMRIPSRVVVGSPTFRLVSILALTLLLALVAGGAVVAGASLLPSPGPRLAPFGPAANGSLLFVRDGDLYLANADGSQPKPIATDAAHDNVGAWFSHDGTHIAIARGVSSVRSSSARLTSASPTTRSACDPPDRFSAACADSRTVVTQSTVSSGTNPSSETTRNIRRLFASM